MCDVRSHKTLPLFEFTCSEHILTFGKLGKLTFAGIHRIGIRDIVGSLCNHVDDGRKNVTNLNIYH